MTLRFEDLARYAVSLTGAAAFTALLIVHSVTVGPLA